jgi:hypothetical protein
LKHWNLQPLYPSKISISSSKHNKMEHRHPCSPPCSPHHAFF